MKIENKIDLQTSDEIESNTGCYGDAMSFSEIGRALGISEFEAKRIFDQAMRKLRTPGFSRDLWDYNELGEMPHISDMSAKPH